MTDFYTTNGSTGDFSFEDVKRAMEKAELIRVRQAVERSRMYFALLGEDCQVCGEPVTYDEGPPEKITVCRHVYENIKRQSTPVESGEPLRQIPTHSPLFLPLAGILVCLKK